MDTKKIIRLNNINKRYELYENPSDRLKQFFLPKLRKICGLENKNYFEEFWALKNVSLEIEKGEAVGIIGRNGAGKSTLLQIISGTLAPSSGEIYVHGKVAALLELGSGFNYDFTGIENIYLLASVLGLKKDEINHKVDLILNFADIGDFVNQPLKTYSSGMQMRLAFAINTCLNPEILIIDEALGVGDAPFQAKCFKHLRFLQERGTTLIFVSHDIEIVKSICSKALWLNSGECLSWGEAKEVAFSYERFCWEKQGVKHTSIVRSNNIEDQIQTARKNTTIRKNFDLVLSEIAEREGNGAVKIVEFKILNSYGIETDVFDYGEDVSLKLVVELNADIDSDYILGYSFKDLKGSAVLSAGEVKKIPRLKGKQKDFYIINSKLSLPLTHQEYAVNVGIFGFSEGNAYDQRGNYDFNRAVFWDLIYFIKLIRVRPNLRMAVPGPVFFEINTDCNIMENS
jgi:lipopolysaccharide transport system ATP-binding protein